MKAAAFDYIAPRSVDEAVAALGDGDAKLLAGGQSLVPLLALRLARFDRLVDINAVGSLSGVFEEDGDLVVGAMTRQALVGAHPLIRSHAPMLTEATQLVSHFQLRNRGTFGGSLAHADPAAEYPAVVLALGALLAATGPGGTREIPADEFFDQAWTTCLDPDEILVSVRVPAAGPRTGSCITEFARRRGDFAIAGVAAVVQLAPDGTVAAARAATFGLSARPRLLPGMDALIGQPPKAIEQIAIQCTRAVEPTEDAQASAAYRSALAPLMLTRAITQAAHRANDGVNDA